jgi:hypothetical protein
MQFARNLWMANPLLTGFGALCAVGMLVCLVLTQVTGTQVLGINAFVKPAKFFISIAIFCWTMAYYTSLLENRQAVTIYSWVVILGMAYELIVITGQAALGKLSHFNIATRMDSALFQTMGIVITIVTLWTAYVGYLFFRQQTFAVPMAVVWGIRLGIIIFVVFAFEGGAMAAMLQHTVGAPDGGAGLPFVNWSTHHGDLRIAHFVGMHALQAVPLLCWALNASLWQAVAVSAAYVAATVIVLVRALLGLPLWN